MSHALKTREYWGLLGTWLNPNTRQANSIWIRYVWTKNPRRKVANSKISGYVWMGTWNFLIIQKTWGKMFVKLSDTVEASATIKHWCWVLVPHFAQNCLHIKFSANIKDRVAGLKIQYYMALIVSKSYKKNESLLYLANLHRVCNTQQCSRRLQLAWFLSLCLSEEKV